MASSVASSPQVRPCCSISARYACQLSTPTESLSMKRSPTWHAIIGNQKRSEAIKGSKKQSKAIIGNHRPSEAINGSQKQSEALIGNQKQSEALKGSQEQSEARIGNQKQSELIRALRSSQGNVRPLTCHQKPSA